MSGEIRNVIVMGSGPAGYTALSTARASTTIAVSLSVANCAEPAVPRFASASGTPSPDDGAGRNAIAPAVTATSPASVESALHRCFT